MWRVDGLADVGRGAAPRRTWTARGTAQGLHLRPDLQNRGERPRRAPTQLQKQALDAHNGQNCTNEDIRDTLEAAIQYQEKHPEHHGHHGIRQNYAHQRQTPSSKWDAQENYDMVSWVQRSTARREPGGRTIPAGKGKGKAVAEPGRPSVPARSDRPLDEAGEEGLPLQGLDINLTERCRATGSSLARIITAVPTGLRVQLGHEVIRTMLTTLGSNGSCERSSELKPTARCITLAKDMRIFKPSFTLVKKNAVERIGWRCGHCFHQ